jgi:hypothetical protein
MIERKTAKTSLKILSPSSRHADGRTGESSAGRMNGGDLAQATRARATKHRGTCRRESMMTDRDPRIPCGHRIAPEAVFGSAAKAATPAARRCDLFDADDQ